MSGEEPPAPQSPGRQRGATHQRLDQLQRLWTPWRMAYIRDDETRQGPGCPFCISADHDPERDRELLVLHRGRSAYAILNAYPYNPGHFMAVPYRHVDRYDALTLDELTEMGELCQRGIRALRSTAGPDGFNVGTNVGEVAGAGIADHVHEHVVPRWGGDTNFMPVVGQTRVLPELLEETYARLRPAFDAA